VSDPRPECACGHGSDLHNLELGRCYHCEVDCWFKGPRKACATCGGLGHEPGDAHECIQSLSERLAAALARIDALEKRARLAARG
jgi:hypothetical protein